MGPLLRPLRIGEVVAPNNLLLAPMAGYTDVAFRILARRHGAGITSTEQVGAGSLVADGAKTALRAAIDGRERPVHAQIIANDPKAAAEAARELAHAEFLGLNLGCPASQVARSGCGAALLDDVDRASALVAAIREASGRPVIAKMRLGNRSRIDAVAFARRLVDAGAAALVVHGRAASDGYRGHADWGAIRVLVEAVDVPVLANGDVVDGPSAAACLAATGAAGLAIGRAALGDPRVFQRIATYLETGSLVPRETKRQIEDLAEYLRLAKEAGIRDGPRLRQTQRFTKGLEGAARIRAALSRGDVEDIEAIVGRLRRTSEVAASV